MTTIHLGVVDIPYSDSSYAAPRKKQRLGAARRGKSDAPHNGAPGTKTTGEVAEILESKYHIMEVFFEDVGVDLISKALANSVDEALDAISQGAPVGQLRPTAGAEAEIETAFRLFLSQQEMDSLGIPGVPTKAAQDGVRHRLKDPYSNHSPRPSFIDTGLYEANFKVWID